MTSDAIGHVDVIARLDLDRSIRSAASTKRNRNGCDDRLDGTHTNPCHVSNANEVSNVGLGQGPNTCRAHCLCSPPTRAGPAHSEWACKPPRANISAEHIMVNLACRCKRQRLKIYVFRNFALWRKAAERKCSLRKKLLQNAGEVCSPRYPCVLGGSEILR